MSTGAACHQVRKADVLVCIGTPFGSPAVSSVRPVCFAPPSRDRFAFSWMATYSLDGRLPRKRCTHTNNSRRWLALVQLAILLSTFAQAGFRVQSRHEYKR